MAAAPTATGSKRKGTHLSILQKLEIIDEKKKGHSVKSLKLHFDAKFKTTIGVQTIRDLIKQEDKLREQCRNISNPKAKTVRKMKTGDVDIATYTWFKTQRAKGLPVSGGMLQLKAQQFNTLMNPGSEFTASKGWLFKFQKRHGIRELSIVGEQNSADVDGANRYLDEIAQLIDENDISLDALYNMDATGLYYLRLPTTTLAAGPEKHVFGFQTNKKRVTIAVCANATGSHRLPLLVIGQFKNPRCLNKVNRDILPCDYTHQPKSWMTSRLFTIWFNETFVPHVTRNLKKQRLPIKALLLLDNASSHDYLEIGDIKCIFLPANVTSLIQPCDQGLIYSLKRRYRRTWMIEMIKKLDTDEDGYISEKIKEWTLLDMIKVIGKEWNDLPVSTLQRCWNKILVKCKSQEADLIEASDSAQEVNEVEQMNTGLARLNIDLESWEEEENHLAIEDELTEDDIIRIATGICCSIAPVIRIWPHWKLRRVKGSNLQMKCIVNTSKPPISMKWLFISVDRNDTLACTKGSNSISLSIKKLKVLDAGAYICVVKLADGKVFTEVAVVFIVDKEMTGLCNEHQFVCKETRVCISKKFLCNRVDDCRDKSDEKDCIVPEPTYAVTKHPDTELGGQTIFVQTAVYSVIGCTIGIILLISVLIIAVFRIRMKRAAVRRAMAPADLANRGNAMPPPGAPPMVPGSHPVPPEYDPFLSPSNQQSQYGNIIVNVNNGVQYVPGSEFPSYIEPPPPYSTVVAGRECSPPPPYSTIDRSAPAAATTSSSVSAAASSSAAAAIPPPQPPPPAHSEPERSPPLLTPPILSDPTQAGELPRAHPPELSSVTTNLLPSCSTDGQLTHPLPGHIIVKDGKIILTPKNS